MNYKLKHLSKFCCKPITEAEFEHIKEAAEQGGVEWYEENEFPDESYPFLSFYNDSINRIVVIGFDNESRIDPLTEISVLDFIKKLRMTEDEARELEGDRVYIVPNTSLKHIINPDNVMKIVANDGHHFRVSEDGLTVTLHKGEKG